MKVIKKDGRSQDFDKDKLYTSLYSASAETSMGELTQSDAKVMVEDIYGKIKATRGEEGLTSSYEIIGTIVRVLSENSFTEILKTYLGK